MITWIISQTNPTNTVASISQYSNFKQLFSGQSGEIKMKTKNRTRQEKEEVKEEKSQLIVWK